MNQREFSTLFGFLLVWMASTAQVEIVGSINSVTVVAGGEESDELSAEWGITNMGQQTMFLQVTRTIEQSIQPWNCPYEGSSAGAYERFCWGVICYPYCSNTSSNSPANLVAIAPGDTNWTFVADYYPDEITGTTSITYCFHPLNGVENGVCHTVAFELLEAQEIAGCTYLNAMNYEPEASLDDGSCQFPGCMDPLALNYSSHFNADNASCIYGEGNSVCPADVTGDGAVNVNDLLLLLGSFGVVCD